MIKTIASCTIMAILVVPSVRAAYTLVDDFESYTVGSYNGGSTAFTANGGPWESNVGATGLVSIENDGNNYLAFGWGSGTRGANRSVTAIANGDTGTYYFRIRTEDATPDTSYGLSDQSTGLLSSFDDFEVQVALVNSGGPAFGARNGATFQTLVTGLNADTWYDVWVVVDNNADTYDVYFGQTGDANALGTLVATDFGFRNETAANDLVTFMTLASNHEDNNANLDNIYYNPAIPDLPDLTFGATSPIDGAVDVDKQPAIEAVIVDTADQLDTNTVALTFDGTNVLYSLSQAGGTSTVSYAVNTPLAQWSVHTARVVAASTLGNYYTNAWSFTVTGPNIIAETGPTNFATLSTDGAWCWYSDPRALFHNGKLYFGYVKSSGKTVLDVFDVTNGETANLWVSGFSQVDDHNVPGLCVKQDGTMLSTYARHLADQYFAYRTSSSTTPDTPVEWNAEQTIPNSGYAMTYANPFQLTSEGGLIYNFCRNYNFNPTVYTSSDGGSSWSSPQQLIAAGSGSVRPYVKYCSDGVDRIEFLYTDGHPRDVANSLYHMYYQGGSFYKTDGTWIRDYINLPIQHDSGERGSVIYQYSDSAQTDPNEWIPTGRAWCWETANDTSGNPVAVFTVQRDLVAGSTSGIDDRIYYYYARWTGAEWQKRFIAHAGRPLYVGEDDYAGGICVDPQNPNVIYISSNSADPFNLSLANTALRASDRYEIWRGETSDGGLTFEWEPVTAHSAVDNLRPYIPRRNGGEECVLWYRGTYNTYSSFNTDIVGLFTSEIIVPPPAAPIHYVDASSGASGNTMEWNTNTMTWVTFNPPLNISSTADDQWEEETGSGWGNGPTENWFESNREGSPSAEDCPQLRTMVSGLPDQVYDVFTYFWVANGQGFTFGAALTNNPNGSLPLYQVGSAGVEAADADAFAGSISVSSSDRTLFQVSLGTVTGTSMSVYIDDEAYGGYDSSCWYDGIGYRLHLSTLPTDIAVAVSNDLLTVYWPNSHKGWMLQSKPILTNDWSDVIGSTTNTSWSIPGVNLQDSEFFRIRYPIE